MSYSELVKEYMANSTLHGAKFLVEKETTWWERIFWFICIIASWCASGMLISASLDAFQNDAIRFVVETSYRDWNTNFPSVVVCEAKNMDRIQEFADEYIVFLYIIYESSICLNLLGFGDQITISSWKKFLVR